MKEHISKSERKRRNQVERKRQLEAFHKVLLAYKDQQIMSIIQAWMEEIKGEDYDGVVDNFCRLLGYHIVSCSTGKTYSSYSIYKESEWKEVESGIFEV